MSPAQRNLFYLIFALSGFTGLIYESIWTRYLRLFLGHSAYAQTLVICVFMGGLAAGSWICGRFLPRRSRLLIGYAVVEGIIGLCALIFHEGFVQFMNVSRLHILPSLQSSYAVTTFKWSASALLILPQTILLGMTFPLMSSGILRNDPKHPGQTLGMLYFANSMGGVLGALACAFLFIDQFGLPGTIRYAGVMNIALAIAALMLARGMAAPDGTVEKQAHLVARAPSNRRILLAVAFFTGTASFIYEIGWIRMLSLVLGSSTHSFEIMLAAFILGLALGSLWVRKRIDRAVSPLTLLASIQICMAVFAAATLPLYGQSFQIIQWLITALEKTNTGYFLYLLSSSGIAMAVMLPATFCAGMTLPLITRILLNEQQGEKNIGYVYALNTAGSIIGVLAALHLGFVYLGLKYMILLGSLIDLLLGAVLIAVVSRKAAQNPKLFLVPAGALLILVLIGLTTQLDPYRMASGVYRHGKMLDPAKTDILFHRDGKTATISVFVTGNKLHISTNGKIDASVGIGPENRMTPSDDTTQVQHGAIPMALNPRARVVANIGFGSGITSAVVLKNPRIRELDTVEIEPLMVEGARHFGERVLPAYNDPRHTIHIDDARTFFTLGAKKYDIIISEPSNPWVSGVANLFTREFYAIIKNSLNRDGIFAQWIQMYELNPALLGSIFKAIDANFDSYETYAMNEGDLIIIAKPDGETGPLDGDILTGPGVAGELRRIFVESPRDIDFRWIGGNTTLRPLFAGLSVQANSDFNPILDQHGARYRFLQSGSNALGQFNYQYFNLSRLLENRPEPFRQKEIVFTPSFAHATGKARMAIYLRDFHLGQETINDENIPDELRQNGIDLHDMCKGEYRGDKADRMLLLYYQGLDMLPFLNRDEFGAVWDRLNALGASKHLNPAEYNLFTLFGSINQRDGERMQSLAANFLDQGGNLPGHVRDFLVATALAGDLLTGNHARAKALWENYRKERFAIEQPPLFFLIIEAHLQAQPGPQN